MRVRRPLLVLAGGCVLIGVVLVVWWQRRVPPPPVDARRSAVAVSTGAVTNDGQALQVTVSVVDTRGRPLAGILVRVVPSAPFMATAHGVTGLRGRVQLVTGVLPAARHSPRAAGAVSLAVQAGGVVLQAAPRVLVYNRVAVLLQGIGTSLDCPRPLCVPTLFRPLAGAVLRPLGYMTGHSAASVVQFSYRGGQMVYRQDHWGWQPASYGTCDTIQSVASSARVLRAMLLAYRARYPFSTFELIGHSLGGLVALEGVADQAFLDRLGKHAVDRVITIDSPVNGITGFDARAWLFDGFTGLGSLAGCLDQGMGFPLVDELSGLGDATPLRQQRWSAVLRAHGAEILSVTNRQDIAVPAQYALIDFGTPVAVADRLEYSIGPAHSMGHSDLLYPRLDQNTPNPVWTDFTQRLRSYLQQPCLAFASSAAACRYPSIDVL